MAKGLKLDVVFYRTETVREPVREWLQALPKEDKRTIGTDIKTVQFGWPLGMPLVVSSRNHKGSHARIWN